MNLKLFWKLKTKEFVKKDKDTLKFLLENKKWDALDSYLNIVLESKNRKRYKGVLKVLKDRKDCSMFKHFLSDLEYMVTEMKHYG